MGHAHQSSPAQGLHRAAPGVSNRSSSASGSRTKSRSCSRGCGTCRPGSSIRSSPYSSRSRSSVRGPPARSLAPTRPRRPRSRAAARAARARTARSRARPRRSGTAAGRHRPDGIGLAERRDGDELDAGLGRQRLDRARDGCSRRPRFAPSPTKLLVMAAIVRHPHEQLPCHAPCADRAYRDALCFARRQAAVALPEAVTSAAHLRRPAADRTLVELTRPGAAARAPAPGGRRLLAPAIGLWRVPSGTSSSCCRPPRRGLVRAAEPECRSASTRAAQAAVGSSRSALDEGWWLVALGATRVDAPGPGVPVTMSTPASTSRIRSSPSGRTRRR